MQYGEHMEFRAQFDLRKPLQLYSNLSRSRSRFSSSSSSRSGPGPGRVTGPGFGPLDPGAHPGPGWRYLAVRNATRQQRKGNCARVV